MHPSVEQAFLRADTLQKKLQEARTRTMGQSIAPPVIVQKASQQTPSTRYNEDYQ